MSSRPADLFVTLFGGTILAASLALAILGHRGVDPVANVDLCWSRILLDRDCPGCGLTRSFVSLAGGDLRRSFSCNPTGPLLFGGILLLTLLHALRLSGLPLRHLRSIDAITGGAMIGGLLLHGFHFYAS